MATKKQNSHTSVRKKAASKAAKPARKSSVAKIKNQELKRRKKLEELTLKMFQEVYEDYQQGKFHRIL
jgi:hypothetical protein